MSESFEFGEYYEMLFASTLNCNSKITKGYFPDYDIITEHGHKFEVKCEDKKWRQTGNHYVEVYNINGSEPKPSGISLSKSDFWVVALADGYNLQEFIIVRTSDLKDLIKSSNFRWGTAKIDVWTKGVLVPISELRKIEIKRK